MKRLYCHNIFSYRRNCNTMKNIKLFLEVEDFLENFLGKKFTLFSRNVATELNRKKHFHESTFYNTTFPFSQCSKINKKQRYVNILQQSIKKYTNRSKSITRLMFY